MCVSYSYVDALNQLITDIKPNESLRLTLSGNAWPELRARRREICFTGVQ